ncbi:MAG: hypothetical protein ACR2LN_06700 [Candidatus Levyibacteriota bacterium]
MLFFIALANASDAAILTKSVRSIADIFGNPLSTEAYNVNGSEGLWFIYANNIRDDYVSMMKEQMSSEWTGFNRFAEEPWSEIEPYVNKDGTLVDIGSSIGISAFEIARTLGMQGSIILLDLQDPLRQSTALRIMDYANLDREFISVPEAMRQMDGLFEDRKITTLFGVDIGNPLSPDIENTACNSSFVHCANTLPYLPPDAIHQSVLNTLSLTSDQGGVVKFHNDDSLPVDNVLLSLTLQRCGNRVKVLPNVTRGKF